MAVSFAAETANPTVSGISRQRQKTRRSSAFDRTPKQNAMVLFLKLFIFIDAFAHGGMSPIVNVYLVVIVGWTPLAASWFWFAKKITEIFGYTIVGHMVDKTTHKKWILCAVALMKIASGAILLTSTKPTVMLCKGVLDGLSCISTVPAITAMTLGTVNKLRFHKKHAVLNVIITDVGTSFSAIIIGATAYMVFPEIQNIFYTFIAAGLLLLVVIFLMPSENATVDHAVARGRSIYEGNLLKVAQLAELIGEIDSDDETEDDVDSQAETKEQSEVANSDVLDNLSPTDQKPTYTKVMSYKEMYSHPVRRRSLLCLSMTFLSFHLVNATVTPLLGQYMGLADKNKRDVIPIMAGLAVMTTVGSLIMNLFLKKYLSKLGYKNVLFIGCGALALRLTLISILVRYTSNLWILGCTNILDGMGGGSLGLMLALYSHLLSRQTGHYNLNMGVITTFRSFGGASSVILGGFLATKQSYDVTFPILAGMVTLPVIFSMGIYTPSLEGKAL